jgi:hypothetical protein
MPKKRKKTTITLTSRRRVVVQATQTIVVSRLGSAAPRRQRRRRVERTAKEGKTTEEHTLSSPTPAIFFFWKNTFLQKRTHLGEELSLCVGDWPRLSACFSGESCCGGRSGSPCPSEEGRLAAAAGELSADGGDAMGHRWQLEWR